MTNRGRGRRVVRGLCLVVSASLFAVSSCGMRFRDAVSLGLFQFVTQSTVNLLGDALPSLGPTDDMAGNPGSGSGDPFDDPPVQP